MPLAEQLLLPESQVCARTVRCDPSTLCWAVGSCRGKLSTPDPLRVGNHREMQGEADNYTGQHQGSLRGSDVSCVLVVFMFPHLQVLPDSSSADF